MNCTVLSLWIKGCLLYTSHRYADALAAPHRHKINSLCFILSDINRVTAPPQFKIHDVFRQAAAAGRQREGQRMELRVGGQNMSSYIEIKNVSKSFGGRAILQNVSLFAEQGTTVGLVGANGSGKSVLFKIIYGIIDFLYQ